MKDSYIVLFNVCDMVLMHMKSQPKPAIGETNWPLLAAIFQNAIEEAQREDV